MDIVQSFVTAVARQGFTQWEARIYYEVLKELQHVVKANPMDTTPVLESVNVHINAGEVLNGSKHTELFEAGIKGLCTKVITYSLYDKTARRDVDYFTPLIYNVAHPRGSALYNCQISKSFVMAFTNMAKGYTKINMQNLITLSSVYSMRLYALLGSQANKTVLKFSISKLREMFNIDPTKYTQTSDFIKRCIEPAARELSERGFNGFDFTPERAGGKITALKLVTIKREEARQEQLLARVQVGMLIPTYLKNTLIEKFGFSSRELSAHKQLLFDFAHVPGYENILATVLEYTRARGRGKGYVINAMRRAVGR